MAKVRVGTVEAIPSKRLYLSIIADYDLNRSVCELVDNALDNWVRTGRKKDLCVDIALDQSQQKIEVRDNAGGIKEDDLKNIVAPGVTGSVDTDHIIGLFGVGTKRAVVALAQNVRISTRFLNKRTLRIELDDDWVHDDNNWELEYYQVDDIEVGSTLIELSNVRYPLSDEGIAALCDHLSVTYAKFLVAGRVQLRVNHAELNPRLFEGWSYPPGYEPKNIITKVSFESETVSLEILSGLSSESSPGGGEYGVYVYCNDRLVGRAIKTFEVGFSRGAAGAPHPKLSLTRAIVSLNGVPRAMPWNSSKSDIDAKHPTFRAIRDSIVQAVSEYAKVSRVMMGRWEEEVFPYKTGDVEAVPLTALKALPKTLLPPPPRSRLQYGEKVEQKNKRIAKKKPWTIGLYEGIIGAHTLRYQKKLTTKNRQALILIDSAVEIAMKDFLVHESGHYYTDDELAKIMKSRHQVVTEVKKYKAFSTDLWKKLSWFYALRCKLVHERATAEISDAHIDDFTSVAETILHELHGLKF